jgi:hypothetical protein
MTNDDSRRAAAEGVLPYADPLNTRGLTAKELYARVPWFRRNSFSNVLLLIAFVAPLQLLVLPRPGNIAAETTAIVVSVSSPLALLVVCIIVLTGPIYLPKVRQDGRLKTWGIGNKVAALMILGGWAWMIARHFVWK